MTLGVQDVFLTAAVICLLATPFTYILKEKKSAPEREEGGDPRGERPRSI
ncbi:hypothetical protein MJA45_14745 [Paenibacillus aurantius]|uniref:Uncharacterized protein n=1 Tax=Paenibacillus aurantius TaxID=2918900 RepID=A0AA96RCN9_9BACL|nr:hypothetical protein [Paenibacillus aurantius]WNQ08907.1 hypothetical protein MJA45_14745 [Paenibacillus aurantius]